MDSLCLKIIELLRQNQYTAEEIGKHLSVSERTIRNRVKEINKEIISHGGSIHSTRGMGYRLEIFNEEMLSEWMKNCISKNTPNTSEERVNYIIDFLLNQNDYVYMDEICDLLYVARNTLSLDLKKVEQKIRKYNLLIERRPKSEK